MEMRAGGRTAEGLGGGKMRTRERGAVRTKGSGDDVVRRDGGAQLQLGGETV